MQTTNSQPLDHRILDLGTGSGCLLLSLLHEFPNATGIGVDVAPRAIEQAKQNAEQLKLSARSDLRVNNWADGIDEQFDLIVSNPPYITYADIKTLMPEVRDYDPALALDGGDDGLNAYRQLIPQLPRLLKTGGLALFEIGKGQGNDVRALFQKAGFSKIETHRDLSQIERCISATI